MGDILRELGSVVGLFVILGVGLGAAGYLVGSQLTLGGARTGGGAGAMLGGLVVVQAFSVVYFSAPLLGAVGGVLAGHRSEDTVTGAVAGGVGSFVGFYLMVAISFLVMTVALPGGGIGFSPGENVTLIAVAGVPTAIVGAVSGVIAGVRRAPAAAASRTAW